MGMPQKQVGLTELVDRLSISHLLVAHSTLRARWHVLAPEPSRVRRLDLTPHGMW
jgi:hypothetical protein